MKTPRRRFLSWLGGAFLSRGLRAEDGLFSGAPAPDDPLELLYSRRLSFSGGEPLITVRILEGRHQVVISPKGRLRALARTSSGTVQTAVEDGPPGRWTLQLLESVQGAGASWVELEQLRFDDKQGLQRARDEWARRGVAVRVLTVGEAYGIAGHVVDTRRYAVLLTNRVHPRRDGTAIGRIRRLVNNVAFGADLPGEAGLPCPSPPPRRPPR